MKSILGITLALVASAAGATCFTFNGQEYCPKDPGTALPCTSTSCLSPDYGVKLPESKVVVEVPPPVVIAPTDANGQPSQFVNVCSPGGCGVTTAPVVVPQPVRVPPPKMYMVIPAPRAVPTVITWGPWVP